MAFFCAGQQHPPYVVNEYPTDYISFSSLIVTAYLSIRIHNFCSNNILIHRNLIIFVVSIFLAPSIHFFFSVIFSSSSFVWSFVFYVAAHCFTSRLCLWSTLSQWYLSFCLRISLLCTTDLLLSYWSPSFALSTSILCSCTVKADIYLVCFYLHYYLTEIGCPWRATWNGFL